jgi:hypothetical protein
MAIYVICNVNRPVKMEAALKKKLPTDGYKRLSPDAEWLISSSLTAKQLAKQIGILDGDAGAALVFRITAFHGKALPGVFEWIENHLGKSLDQG